MHEQMFGFGMMAFIDVLIVVCKLRAHYHWPRPVLSLILVGNYALNKYVQ